MIDLLTIKNPKLRELVKNSKKFSQLSKEDQQKHIERINALSPKQQEEVIKFLAEENKKEQLEEEEKLKMLTKIYQKVTELEEKFDKLLKADAEKKDKEKEGTKMDDLIQQLNH